MYMAPTGASIPGCSNLICYMTAAVPSAINYDDLLTNLVSALETEAYDFIERYISENTEVAGIDYQELRDKAIDVVNERLTIAFK